MWLNLCQNGNKRTYSLICSETFPFIPLYQDRVNACFELVLLVVRCERKVCCSPQLPLGTVFGLNCLSRLNYLWMFGRRRVRVTVGVSWVQGEDNWEMFAVTGALLFLAPLSCLHSSAPRGFAFWWSLLSCRSRAGCSGESSWSLQLQVVLQLALMVNIHLLQDKLES